MFAVHGPTDNIFLENNCEPRELLKILKRSLIDKFIKTQTFDCQSAVFDK